MHCIIKTYDCLSLYSEVIGSSICFLVPTSVQIDSFVYLSDFLSNIYLDFRHDQDGYFLHSSLPFHIKFDFTEQSLNLETDKESVHINQQIIQPFLLLSLLHE